VNVRYRGLKRNTVQLNTLFALAILWRVRKKLAILGGNFRAQGSIAA
jgi:IS5 family transposase